MKAVVFHGVGDIRLDDVPEPKIKDPTDAIVRITASAICGTDLHMIRGTFPGMRPGTILGHEGVGVVEEVGPDVRNLTRGDRVVIASTIACGWCSYCRAGYYSQCDNANPGGPQAGTAFFGGPEGAGGFDGLQAEYARVPFASVGLWKLPSEVSDEQAIMLSDIFPTGYYGAEIAEIAPGDAVAVFGCGPVGQFAIASAKLLDAGRIFAIDTIPSRLEMARAQGAEVIDYNAEEPVETIRRLTGGIGVDRVIEAVGVDANRPSAGPASQAAAGQEEDLRRQVREIAPHAGEKGDSWHPGDAPSQALQWAVNAVDKAGTVAIVGVYPHAARVFPIGTAMLRNLTLNMGNCPHRRYIPKLVEIVASGVLDPTMVLTNRASMTSAIEAYASFDQRQPGWVKVMLQQAEAVRAAA